MLLISLQKIKTPTRDVLVCYLPHMAFSTFLLVSAPTRHLTLVDVKTVKILFLLHSSTLLFTDES